jgi:tetratricopeptide (TPR) repeat protein/predicted Ser/Thr protein kinase
MKTDDKHFSRIRDLFVRAIELAPENRDVLIEQECSGDPALATELRKLLSTNTRQARNHLTSVVSGAIRRTSRGRPEELVGSILGSYKLISVLGQGGAGTVYLAERADRKYAARVAIKIVEAEAFQSDLGVRAIAERQILASLNHPNIARLIDAGETPQHHPYIVMEYVHGMPLDDYSDGHRLTVRQRLQLFLHVCAAVQYAHQNLVVHRDLKPGNILVAEDGAAKLLDFGIAKLLASTGIGLAHTRLNDRALTPEYASPEQITGRPITTASDVYALGVVLYELLSGHRPYTLSNTSHLELERAICATDPPKPSNIVGRAMSMAQVSDPKSIEAIADARRLSTKRLRQTLVGDLDAIVMRAMRKEPEHRYTSVEQFAADIQRYLNLQPVIARQGTWLYYSTRFVRRNTVPVGATALVLTAIIVSTTTISIEYKRAQADRDKAMRAQQVSDRVSKFMDMVFSEAHPYATGGHSVTARELLDSAQRRSMDLSEDPEVRGRLARQMGYAYLMLAEYPKAVEHLENAANIERKAALGTDPTHLISVLTDLAMAQRGMANFDASERALQEALKLLGTGGSRNSTDYIGLLRGIGRLEHTRGDLKAAERYYVESVALARKLHGEQSIQVGQVLNDLSALYSWSGNLKTAEETAREALSIFSTVAPELHPDRIFAQLGLGDVLSQEGHLEEAAAMMSRAVLAQRAIYNNTGPELAQSLSMLSWIRASQDRVADAEGLIREALDLAQRSLGHGHYQTGFYHTSLATVLVRERKYEEAQSHLHIAIDIYGSTLPKDHQYVASARHWLGEALLANGRAKEALAELESAMEIWKKSNGPEWMIARTQSALGQALMDTGQLAQGRRELRTAYEYLRANRGAEREETRIAAERLQRANKGPLHNAMQ